MIIIYFNYSYVNAFYIKPVNRGMANKIAFDFMKKKRVLNDLGNSLSNENLLYDLT